MEGKQLTAQLRPLKKLLLVHRVPPRTRKLHSQAAVVVMRAAVVVRGAAVLVRRAAVPARRVVMPARILLPLLLLPLLNLLTVL